MYPEIQKPTDGKYNQNKVYRPGRVKVHHCGVYPPEYINTLQGLAERHREEEARDHGEMPRNGLETKIWKLTEFRFLCSPTTSTQPKVARDRLAGVTRDRLPEVLTYRHLCKLY